MLTFKSRSLLATALLLFCGFVFACTLLPKVIGVPEVSMDSYDDLVDEENGAAAVWLNGDHVDADENKIESVGVYVAVSVITENNQEGVYYYADTTSGLSDSTLNGRAFFMGQGSQ